MSDTVRVRIAVVVDEKGQFNAAGWDLPEDGASTEEDMVQVALGGFGVDSEHERIHWIEADIPIPSPQTIEGEVTE